MAIPPQHTVHTHELLPKSTEWYFRDSIEVPRDLPRHCKANTALEFRQEANDISACVLISAGCSHIAVIEARPLQKSITVTVWELKDGFIQKWTSMYHGSDAEFQPSTGSWYDNSQMHGGVTEDGHAVLLVYRSGADLARAYVVRETGFTVRAPPSDTNIYSSSVGLLSEDSECLLYTRGGSTFGHHGEARVVEAYSIRHLARVRAETFGFGDGRNLRNGHLLRQFRVADPMYLAISTSSFGDDEGERESPCLIASSDKRLHWNFAGLDTARLSNAFISPDGAHMFYAQSDTAILQHWDLRRPTLNPLGSVRLPGVEYSQSQRWRIHGKETNIRTAIAEQIRNIRYSPKCKVITVVTVNHARVVVNVFLTFNLQLIYHSAATHREWRNLVPLHIGFNDSTGLNVFAMYPTTSTASQGLLRLWGLTGKVMSLSGVWSNIKAIEDYFDSTTGRIEALKMSVHAHETSPKWRFNWDPEAEKRNAAFAIEREHGPSVITTEIDALRQKQFYNLVFANPKASWRMDSTQELRHYFVPHLISFECPWAPDQRISIFGVVMKYEFYVIAIGPAQSAQSEGEFIIRTLYATDTTVGNDAKQRIEIFESDSNYILYVSKMDNELGGYSGAPMPIPRWTVISPHFLEEDAWYDTFIIKQARHVTMPAGWTSTPNMALTNTTSFYAYFEPNTYVIQSVVNYGHRARSAYAAPKYLLWQEYGLRGLRKATTNDIFFGGGQYVDIYGAYFRSIYEDRTYDDSRPLFSSTFAIACNADHRTQQTKHVDAFFRLLHRSNEHLLNNSQAVSCTLPLACRTRPIASLSFIRHIVLFPYNVNDIGAVEVRKGATRPKQPRWSYDSKWYAWISAAREVWALIWSIIVSLFGSSGDIPPEPNISRVTLPLPGFCSFEHKLYKAPPVSHSSSSRDNPFWEFIRATGPDSKDQFVMRWERYIVSTVLRSSKGPASPFTRLVEEILAMKDHDIQLSFLRVIWIEKLLTWKMKTFGSFIYFTRIALPMLFLFILHLMLSVLLTGQDTMRMNHRRASTIALASIEAVVACYVLFVKIRQIYRIPGLFFRSVFNYIDGTAVSLGLTMFFFVISKKRPPRAFLGFSTLLIWIAVVLMLRIYQPIGLLLLLLTETLQQVFTFLVLFFFIILGWYLHSSVLEPN
jgi:hypothetical protein